jgi:hypothetical protein
MEYFRVSVLTWAHQSETVKATPTIRRGIQKTDPPGLSARHLLGASTSQPAWLKTFACVAETSTCSLKTWMKGNRHVEKQDGKAWESSLGARSHAARAPFAIYSSRLSFWWLRPLMENPGSDY